MKSLFFLVATLSLPFFCMGQEKNIEYFLSNPNEIEKTIDKCDHVFLKALDSGDDKKIDAIMKSNVCKAASAARSEIRHSEWVKDMKEKEEERIEKERKFNNDKKQYADLLKSMSMKELEIQANTLAEDCGFSSSMGRNMSRKPECSAFFENLQHITTKLSSDSLKNLTYEEVKLSLEEKGCHKKEYLNQSYACYLEEAKLKESYKRTLNDLIKNKNKVTLHYNECVDNYKNIVAESGRRAGREYTKTDKCSLALDAVKKLKLLRPTQMNFEVKIK